MTNHQNTLSGLGAKCRAFCEERSAQLVSLYLLCFGLSFSWLEFDYNSRFFRIPLLVLAPFVLLGVRRQGETRRPWREPLLWSVAALAASGLLAGYFSPYPKLSSYHHILFGWLVLTLAGYSARSASDEAIRVFMAGLVGGLLIAALWSLVGLAANFVALDDITWDLRLMLFAGYPTKLGMVSALALTGQYHMLRHGRVLFGKKIDPALFLFIFILALLAQTRTALLAAFAAMALNFILSARRPLRVVGVMTGAGALCILIFIALSWLGPLKNFRPYMRMVSTITDPMSDFAVEGRLLLWETAWNIFKERPITGQGVRMYREAYSRYMDKHSDEVLQRYIYMDIEGLHAHNILLGILSEQGLAGLAPLLAIFCLILGARGAPCGGDSDFIRTIFVYFLIQGCGEYMLTSNLYSDHFFALIGIFAAVRVSARAAGGGKLSATH